METRIINEPRPTPNKRRSKYGASESAIRRSLRENGPDERYRAIVGSEHWSRKRLDQTYNALKNRVQRHCTNRTRLSLGRCSVNGLVFRWYTADEDAQEGAPATITDTPQDQQSN